METQIDRPTVAEPRPAAWSGAAIAAIAAFVLGLASLVLINGGAVGVPVAVIALVLAFRARADLRVDPALRGTTLSLIGFLAAGVAAAIGFISFVLPFGAVLL